MAVAMNDVIAGLIAGIPALTGWNVFDSWPMSNDLGNFVAVGVDDPLATAGTANSGDATVDWALASGRKADEDGNVHLGIVAALDETEAPEARAAAFDQLNAIDGWLRGAQYPFGLPYIWSVRVASYRLAQDQNENGAICMIIATIAYKARLGA